MTTPKEFYESLAQVEPCIIPVPSLPIKIGQQDIMAARLLLWLYSQMSPDSTQGDIDDVLDAAKWWCVFFAAAHTAKMQPNNRINADLLPPAETPAPDGGGS